MKRAAGFSTIELLAAMAIVTTCMAAMLALVRAGQTIARRQPEAADQQQRARTALQVLGAELSRAGTGLDRGSLAGPLARYFPPIALSADGGLTIWQVSPGGSQAALAAPLEADASTAAIDPGGACPPATSACGFSAARTAIVFDASGCHDAARVDDVTSDVLVLRSGGRRCAYDVGSPIALGDVRTYRVDTAAQQLLRRDEATGSVQPVLDRVAGMSVDIADGGRRVRLTLRFASSLIQVPELVLTLDTLPRNLRGS